MRALKRRPVLIGIAGGSGSGKTHLSRQVQVGAGEERVAVLSMDQYFTDEEQREVDPSEVNFDHPGHIDFRGLIRDMKALKRGRSIHAPAYDFKRMRSEPKAIFVPARPIVIVEGLFVLADPVHHLFDLTCFLDVQADQRLLGRILRDVNERASDLAQIVDRYQRFVRPSYDIFVGPTINNADVVVDFTYRRALFAEMLTHIARDTVLGDLDIDEFIGSVRRESFRIGYRPESPAMPMTIDIFKLAKAYPPSMVPPGIPDRPTEHPRLFLAGNGKSG